MLRRLVSPTSFVMLAQVSHGIARPRKANYDAEKAGESISMSLMSIFSLVQGMHCPAMPQKVFVSVISRGICAYGFKSMIGGLVFDNSMVVKLHPFATNG